MNLRNSLPKKSKSSGKLNAPFCLKDSTRNVCRFPLRHISRFTIAFPTGAPYRLCFVMSLITLFASVQSLAADFAVPGDYQTITEALAVADNGDKILVDGQTYLGDANESFPLRIQKAISLIRDNETGEKPHLKGDGKHTVVLIESGGVTLKGFQITGGKGSEGINNMDGGGVCIFVGPSETNAVTIENCLIRDNNCPSDETYDGCGGGIYCGGTYCTCFEINIIDCNICDNSVHGQGGGVFCALLSNVNIQQDTVIWQNIADDHGGGVFVDVFASVMLTDTCLKLNNCPGDLIKQDWGGKGGGLACESYGLFTATDCIFAENTARNFGGGIFTRGGFFTAEGSCGTIAQFPYISNSLIEKNHAELSGGGVYVAGSGVLDFSDTTFYWNNAGQDGGAIFVAGGLIVGGDVYLGDDCLLEGNECAGRGGGVYLGPYAHGTFESMRFLGNSSLFDGGAMFLETGATSELTNCLITYNNSARGYAGGIRVTEQPYIDTNNLKLDHCSIVGNFAPHKRSGLYLDPNAVVNVTNSILWRNAGGSIQDNGATVNITCSLNEDGADPNNGVLCCDPNYVGWGSLEGIYVDASSPCPGIGTPESPYCDLQTALDRFDFHLAANSPCVGAACDGGNLGADTGVGSSAGNIPATLFIANGTYDIRGRNIIFTHDVHGSDPNLSIIRHAVFGSVEDALIKDLCITGEEIFGGIAVRSNVKFENCSMNGNTALAKGGGIYVAEGHCDVNNTVVSNNACQSGNGGGYYACSGTINSVTKSIIAENSSSNHGGGMFLVLDSNSLVISSQFISNSAHDRGGGIYIAGQLKVTDVNFYSNTSKGGGKRGGGIYISDSGAATIFSSRFFENSAGLIGGGICSFGEIEIHSSWFESNVAKEGGAIGIVEEPASRGYCSESQFYKNKANWRGGAIYVWRNTSPVFVDCQFEENSAKYGGAGICRESYAMFDRCTFKDNIASNNHGGCFYIWSTGSQFYECMFMGNSAKQDGGVAYLFTSDASLFEDCISQDSISGRDGGAFFITDSAQPMFSNVNIVNSQAGNNGGGIAILETSKPSFSQVTISSCQAVLFGGGVFSADNTQCTFEKCELLNNQTTGVSADGGGAFFRENANGLFARCIFHDNIAKDDGGGVAGDENANLYLRNTLFASNTAGNTGGGAFFTSTSLGTLTNCTVVSNKANGESGGGIYMDADSTIKVDSSIICQNDPDGIRPDANPNVSYSCTQKLWPDPGNIIDCEYCLLDPNTFEPHDGSPCIDAGNPDPNMNDSCLPPGKGDLRNDMGITGGPDNCVIDFQRQFDFTTFSDSDFLVLRGNASFTDGLLRLTEAQMWKVGGAWYALPVYIQEGFETVFKFRIDRDGRDGFAFVVQNYSLAALGSNAEYIGYNIPNSIAVEFDTYRNSGLGDTNANHVCVQTRGTLTNSPDHQYSLGCNDDIPPLSDNQPHTAKVVYVPGQLSVFVDDMQIPALIIPEVDLGGILSLCDGHAFVGFTASTRGGLVETHDILYWSFTSVSTPAGDD